MKKKILKLLNRFGYDLVLTPPNLYSKDFLDIYEDCKEYTCTSIERMHALYKSVEYILKNNIQGDFIECGVWRGGSCMLIAKTLKKYDCKDRQIILFDTFEGMSEPTDIDIDFKGAAAKGTMDSFNKKFNFNWFKVELSTVENNMKKTGYPLTNIKYVKGMVEDTLSKYPINNKIALLRLDTDWYESTKAEMNYLFPHLEKGGVLIVDDYGYWQGARKAIEEYIAETKIPLLLNTIDYTGRIGVKL